MRFRFRYIRAIETGLGGFGDLRDPKRGREEDEEPILNALKNPGIGGLSVVICDPDQVGQSWSDLREVLEEMLLLFLAKLHDCHSVSQLLADHPAMDSLGGCLEYVRSDKESPGYHGAEVVTKEHLKGKLLLLGVHPHWWLGIEGDGDVIEAVFFMARPFAPGSTRYLIA